MKKLFAIVALSMAISAGAYAQTKDTAPYWYIGAGVGAADIDGLCHGASDMFCDDQATAARLFGGWRVNPYFALELALDIGGEFTTPGARAAGLDGHTTTGGLTINAIGFIPLGSRVSLFGGVAGSYQEATTKVYDYRYRSTSQDCDWEYDYWDDDWYYYCRNRHRYEDDYRSDGSLAGGVLAGVEVAFNRRFSLRLQGQRFFNVDGGLAFEARRDLDYVTANFLFAFR